jgi:hypothetical protein
MLLHFDTNPVGATISQTTATESPLRLKMIASDGTISDCGNRSLFRWHRPVDNGQP